MFHAVSYLNSEISNTIKKKIDLGHLMVSCYGFFLILVQAALTQDLDSVKLQVEDLQREKVPADSLSSSISFP